ncbi:DUF418 domain-containing protein [Halalkalibacterium halodurans]|uniref:DUF418 domain-containing protein n=1 Tax=Halalkalibacterium halodurans TaxID=86665 RepID=UPI001067E78C|nr:DUF418 domain-containing protein [Halalkalibacterium halodurans]MED3645280.1 DUF418 domain-containing protein [Halalkalibacterium halodurans]TES54307.1 DUF418 domain-containing protein [Halalkalibacterium halodurans]
MNERIQTIDVLRGLCLFGILQANLLIFQYGIWGKDEISLFSLSPFDTMSYYAVKLFIEASFMPIFAFLFGYGMVIMRERSMERDGKPKRKLARRFLFILFLGYLHSTFLWEGDILLTYGMICFILLLFVARKKKTILIWATILLVLSSLFGLGAEIAADSDEEVTSYIKTTNHVYQTGTYLDIKAHRNTSDPGDLLDMPKEAFLFISVFAIVLITPMFLYGMYAAKRKWFVHPTQEQGRYRKGLLFIPVGVTLKALPLLFSGIPVLGVLSLPGSYVLAFGYIFLIAYCFAKWRSHPLFRAAANVGKLSLTNYLLQTVVCTFIFYGYGLGLFSRLGVFFGILLGIVLFSLQLIGSTYYLKTRKSGPFEWLLRAFTHWTLPWKLTKRKESQNLTPKQSA